MSYVKIDYIEYNKIKIIDFESNEIDKLSKYYPNLELSRVYTLRSSIGNVTTIINIYFKYFNIIIFKQEDDFYTVEKREKTLSGSILLETSGSIIYYNCDQLSGLLKCLKQIIK